LGHGILKKTHLSCDYACYCMGIFELWQHFPSPVLGCCLTQCHVSLFC